MAGNGQFKNETEACQMSKETCWQEHQNFEAFVSTKDKLVRAINEIFSSFMLRL